MYIRIASVSKEDLATHTAEVLSTVQRSALYVTQDGRPVAGIVSLDIMSVIEEVLEDEALSAVTKDRIEAVENGEALLDEEEFLLLASRIRAGQKSPGSHAARDVERAARTPHYFTTPPRPAAPESA